MSEWSGAATSKVGRHTGGAVVWRTASTSHRGAAQRANEESTAERANQEAQ